MDTQWIKTQSEQEPHKWRVMNYIGAKILYTIEIKLALTETRLLQIKMFILISMATPNN